MRTIIKNGMIATACDTYRGDILIEDGRIKDLSWHIESQCDQEIDAEGMVVIPGGVDVHTHFNLHSGSSIACDDFYSGTVAAACGGTTCIVDHMGFGPKGCSIKHQAGVYHGYADGNAVIDYGFHGVIQHVDKNVLSGLKDMVDDGIPSFKIYLTYDYKVSDSDAFLIMERLRDYGGLITVHCENDSMVNLLRRRFIEEGKTAPLYHPLSRPDECEEEAVERMVKLAKMAKSSLYIVHLTTIGGLKCISKAQREGQTVFAETCPQYLLLNEEKYGGPGDEGLKYIMSPPLRKRENSEALWRGIKNSNIQVVATDHCPFPFSGDKQLGKDDFTRCPNGAPGVEERIPLIFSEGVMAGRISINKFVEVCCTNPAKIFGLYPEKGTIAPGSDADIVIIDPHKKVTLNNNILHSRCDYTAYEGFNLTGYPVLTMSRGEVVARDGEFTGNRGRGKYIKRKRRPCNEEIA